MQTSGDGAEHISRLLLKNNEKREDVPVVSPKIYELTQSRSHFRQNSAAGEANKFISNSIP